MALFLNKWGDIRGKVADLVFSNNAGGSYIRSKVTPINPMSAKQIAARSRLSQMSAEYSYTLTDAQRQEWNQLAKNTPYKNIFGESKNLNGLAMYVKINTHLQMVGAATLTNAPHNLAVRPLNVDLQQIPTTADPAFTVNVTPIPTATEMIIFHCTPSIRPSINFVKNLYRYAYSGTVMDTEQILTIPANVTTVQVGMKIEGLVYRLNLTTGGVTLGVPVSGTAIA